MSASTGVGSVYDAARPKDGLRLVELAREIPGGAEVVGDGDTRVFGVQHDSRRVESGDLFVAKKGAQADGARFVQDARNRGAAAILAARAGRDAVTVDLPQLLVDDVADGLAFAAAAVYGHPSFALDVIGITGTNGKTTTAHLVRAAIDRANAKPSTGIVGTVGHVFGDLVIDASHTTPEGDELARVMALMKKRGASYVAMEVSSIALTLGRVRAVRFRVAAFTNLTQDHLDFHGSMESYADAKALLFTTFAPGSAVVHVGDPFGAKIAARVKAPLVRVTTEVGASAAVAEIAPLRVTMDARGIDVTLRTPRGEAHVKSRLVGRHNLENIVVAMGVACALELDIHAAAEGIGMEAGVPGRLERVDTDADDITVLVDYAHTPDALARVLDSVRDVVRAPGAHVCCVFGCGGDRDKSKRPLMGTAAMRADLLIITNDNPRSEDPEAIARPIEEVVRAAGWTRLRANDLDSSPRCYAVELDRARAIDAAIQRANAGDVIVLAGKGHEDYQIIGDEKRHFDDREEARRALAVRRGGG
ncbi:MAG: UDP-N-acetylmuramoylalanyl-D-glutamate--2,6-diaminopimelate ligase [Myxococcaceae bacterium]|nr:UDP-N-acetylmuramoylalanyl-D-glutamate--2,6-diaminopimelate ligase [Myxococcaceae bacterium]